MNLENYDRREYDATRLFILNLPYDIAKANEDALKAYGINLFTKYRDHHVIAVCASGFFRRLACLSGHVKIGNMDYAVVQKIKPSGAEELQIEKTVTSYNPKAKSDVNTKGANKQRFKSNNRHRAQLPNPNGLTRPQAECKPVKKSIGRGLLSRYEAPTSESETESETEIIRKLQSVAFDGKIKRSTLEEDYMRVERKLPDFFKAYIFFYD